MTSVYDFKETEMSGEELALETYRGQVLLCLLYTSPSPRDTR